MIGRRTSTSTRRRPRPRRAQTGARPTARRAAHNAPKKIKMLEPKIEEKEAAILELDAELTAASADVEKV